MRRVTIKRNTDGDTRVAKAVPNFYNFKKSNEQHREDVRKMMCEIADDINVAGMYHDYTKTDNDAGSLFYRELCNTIEGRIEMICYCVCAGLARSGSVYPIEISSEILQRAVSNTVEMCINAVDIEEGD